MKASKYGAFSLLDPECRFECVWHSTTASNSTVPTKYKSDVLLFS